MKDCLRCKGTGKFNFGGIENKCKCPSICVPVPDPFQHETVYVPDIYILTEEERAESEKLKEVASEFHKEHPNYENIEIGDKFILDGMNPPKIVKKRKRREGQGANLENNIDNG